jgi:hypothetical protein
MSVRNDHSRELSFGIIAVESASPINLVLPNGRQVETQSFKYHWQAPPSMQSQLPEGFRLSLTCIVGPDGLRRFWPCTNLEGFIAMGFAGGVATLCQRKNLNAEERYSYRAMWLLFLQARRMKEFLGYSFAYSRDLYVSESGRTSREDKDVLPETLGLDDRGNGQRWSVHTLTQRGLEAATAAGVTNPNSRQRIQYGLFEAAKLNPMVVHPENVLSLIRSALFRPHSASTRLDQDFLDIVAERTLEALSNHLADAAKDFDKWFLGPKRNLVLQIAKQKRSRGGELDKDKVRAALMELGWQAYSGYVAQCLDVQMRIVMKAIPDPLSEIERGLFEQVFFRQAHFGGLTLALLAERLGFIQRALWNLLVEPGDARGVSILHRLLEYYAIMAEKRQIADRAIKRRRPQAIREVVQQEPEVSSAVQIIANRLCERHGTGCGCFFSDMRVIGHEHMGDRVSLQYRCSNCNNEQHLTVSLDEFRRVGEALFPRFRSSD